MIRPTLLLLVPALLGACAGEPPDPSHRPPPGVVPGALEIGVSPGGVFRPYAPGEVITATLQANGFIMFQPSLRAVGIEPDGARAWVEVLIDGQVSADPFGGRLPTPMVPDGDGYYLPDFQAVFRVLPCRYQCCFMCRDATLYASLLDVAGRWFQTEITVQFDRGRGCPDACGPGVTDVCVDDPASYCM